MSKQTLGPWRTEETKDSFLILAEGKCDAQIADIAKMSELCSTHDEPSADEAKANARLIAMAPELLEALLIAREQLKQAYAWIPHVLIEGAIVDADKAIAKAEGKDK